MSETLTIATLLETARTYLTVQVGGITFAPLETSIFVVALAAALLSGFNLLRISRHEDRSGRLVMLRDTSLDTAEGGRARGPRWYDRLGSLVAASPIVGIAEQQRLLGALAAAGIKGHGNLATFIASKVCGAAVFSALLWFFSSGSSYSPTWR